MGYRSDVRCLIYGPEEQVCALVAKHKLTADKTVFDDCQPGEFTRYKAVRQVYVGNEEGWQKQIVEVLDFKFDDVKWYDGYEDVARFEQFMTEEATEFLLNFEFVRIGEDEEDIDHRGTNDGDNFLSVTRLICCDVERIGEPVEA